MSRAPPLTSNSGNSGAYARRQSAHAHSYEQNAPSSRSNSSLAPSRSILGQPASRHLTSANYSLSTHKQTTPATPAKRVWEEGFVSGWSNQSPPPPPPPPANSRIQPAGPSLHQQHSSPMSSSRNGASRNARSSSMGNSENSSKGKKITELPIENQRQIEQSTMNLDSWEQLAIQSIARGESLPQARLRETAALIRAADATMPPPSQPYHKGASRPAYIGSTYMERTHDPAPSDNYSSARYHGHNRHLHTGNNRHGSSGSHHSYGSNNTSRNREGWDGTPDELDAWIDEVDVPWEDRHKVTTSTTATSSRRDGRRDEGKSGRNDRERGWAETGGNGSKSRKRTR